MTTHSKSWSHHAPGSVEAPLAENTSLGRRFKWVLFLLVFWSVFQVFAGNKNLPFFETLARMKALLPPILLFCVYLIHPVPLKVPRSLRPLLIFCVYGAISSIARPTPKVMTSLLYLVWGLVMCVQLPNLLNTRARLRAFVKANAIALLLAVSLMAIVGIAVGEVIVVTGGGRDRYAFGYNAAYWSMSAGTLCLLSVAWSMFVGRQQRWMPFLLLVTGLIFVILSTQRSMMVLLFTFFIVFYLHHTGRKRLLGAFGLFIGVCVVFATIFYLTDPTTSTYAQDRVASGRFNLWKKYLTLAFPAGEPWRAIFGVGALVEGDNLAWASSADWQESHPGLRHRHVDSLYFDILIAHGIVGLGFFGNAMVRCLGLREVAKDPDFSPTKGFIRGVWAFVLTAGMTMTTLPSFGNPLQSVVIPLACAFTMLLKAEGREAVLGAKQAPTQKWAPPGLVRGNIGSIRKR